MNESKQSFLKEFNNDSILNISNSMIENDKNSNNLKSSKISNNLISNSNYNNRNQVINDSSCINIIQTLNSKKPIKKSNIRYYKFRNSYDKNSIDIMLRDVMIILIKSINIKSTKHIHPTDAVILQNFIDKIIMISTIKSDIISKIQFNDQYSIMKESNEIIVSVEVSLNFECCFFIKCKESLYFKIYFKDKSSNIDIQITDYDLKIKYFKIISSSNLIKNQINNDMYKNKPNNINENIDQYNNKNDKEENENRCNIDLKDKNEMNKNLIFDLNSDVDNNLIGENENLNKNNTVKSPFTIDEKNIEYKFSKNTMSKYLKTYLFTFNEVNQTINKFLNFIKEKADLLNITI